MKDNEDQALEQLFRSGPVADDGFSRQVLKRIRRRIWIRRLALPIAFVVGGAIAFRPASEVAGSLYSIAGVLPTDLLKVPADSLPQLSTFIVGAAVIAAVVMFIPALED